MVLKWANGDAAVAPGVAANPVLDDLTAQIGPGPIRGLLASLDAQMVQVLGTPCDADPAALSHLAHSLRGAAGALGFGDAALACQAVETAHRSGASAARAFAALQSACFAARAALEQRLAA